MDSRTMLSQGLARSLFQMTWPMIFGVLALMSYHLVDAFWIARLGVEPLAALGFTVPVQQSFTGFQVGLGIAATAIISRTLGADDAAIAQRQGGVVVLLGSAAAGVLALLLWWLRGPLLTALGAGPEIRPVVDSFWSIWLVSAWLGAVMYLGYSLHRAQGDTRFPGLMMLVASVLNMGLDPLFIFTLELGLRGAAWATIVSFSLACLLTYPRLFRRCWIAFDLDWTPVLATLRQLSSIGAPAMVSQLLPPVSAMLATGLVAGFGAAAVAAWGLGTRLEFFSLVVVLALTMSMPPMVGRLVGSGELAAARRLIRLAALFVLGWQLIVSLLWIALSDWVLPLVSADASVAAVLQAYLYRVPLSYPALGICMLMVSVNNALGMPLRALLISGLRLFAFYLPCLWLGAWLGGLPGLLTGALSGNLLAGVTAWVLYRQGMARLESG
ncbi:MATE family efflux transporter [Natronospirillum operosum]|uniref:MATE family efflux transporter n=1 Tax=Natronospirillum operosum TaxID=2759953 RepID=A0A4Z0WC60_9GAMM|nr:MATE family efflux transporter [Natronospirillum operosum]TGG95762.1 MATE family efflux transporter [Natronospirillum operosum]